MAPRRTHKKSRTGCDTCRQRHVKCDEQGPPCTRCATRMIACQFSRRSVTSQSSPSASTNLLVPASESNRTNSPHSSEGNTRDDSTSPPVQRLLELELLHYYSTKTYQGFALFSSEEKLWQTVVVEEALKFDFLMKQLFALAALHKAIETPKLVLKYTNYALESQNEALALFRDSLQTASQENSSALFIFSLMTTIFAIVPLESVPGISLHTPLENLLILFEFLKGAASVLHLCKPWLESGPFRWIFTSKSTNDVSTADKNFSTTLKRLLELNNNYNPTYGSTAIFSRPIANLSFCSTGSKGRIIAWLGMAGQEFMTKVKEDDPMALLVLLHWAVLLKKLNDLWWARNAGRRIVEDLLKVLEKVVCRDDFGGGEGWGEVFEWAKLE